jgi:hypothetical protein
MILGQHHHSQVPASMPRCMQLFSNSLDTILTDLMTVTIAASIQTINPSRQLSYSSSTSQPTGYS